MLFMPKEKAKEASRKALEEHQERMKKQRKEFLEELCGS